MTNNLRRGDIITHSQWGDCVLLEYPAFNFITGETRFLARSKHAYFDFHTDEEGIVSGGQFTNRAPFDRLAGYYYGKANIATGMSFSLLSTMPNVVWKNIDQYGDRHRITPLGIQAPDVQASRDTGIQAPEVQASRIIIGLTGRARAGKDTVAHCLVTHHGYTRVAFADKLKDAAYALNPIVSTGHTPIDYEQLQYLVDEYGWETAKDRYEDVRRILQALGTEAGWQVHGKNLWVNAAAATIDTLPANDPVVISDVRFQHEVDWIRSQGGIIINVTRPHHDDALAGATAAHLSEALDITPDMTLCNDGDLIDIRDTVNDVVFSILEGGQEKVTT